MFGLIALDFVLGVTVALFDKKFKWSELATFLDTNVLRLAGGYFLVGMFAIAEPTIGMPAVTASWLIINATLLADCVSHFKELGVIINKENK